MFSYKGMFWYSVVVCLLLLTKCERFECQLFFPFRANNKDLRECRDQIQMYQEMTAVKDQVVVSLTNQVNNDYKLNTQVNNDYKVNNQVNND